MNKTKTENLSLSFSIEINFLLYLLDQRNVPFFFFSSTCLRDSKSHLRKRSLLSVSMRALGDHFNLASL